MTNREHHGSLDEAIVDTIREPLVVLDGALRVIAASRSFYLKFKVSQRDRKAFDDKTARLRALRLAKEAAEGAAVPSASKPIRKSANRRPNVRFREAADTA